ncbi:MAG TPA: YerC/YecD family TrpR-related protein [Gaiella sp.]|jgi:TrpR-related protein YerC/YecD|nr:YerC/YecD family TrpR-related protein [Gaiella sp.]
MARIASTPAGVAVEPVPGLNDLANAMLAVRTQDEAQRFLRDLCTLPELEALAHRWQIVLLLDEGASYVDIAERVPTSTATVTRVAQWLRRGTGGYALVLDRVKRRRRR